MCDQLCDNVSFCVWSCDAGKSNVGLYDEIVIETKKERDNSPSNNGLGMEFTTC